MITFNTLGRLICKTHPELVLQARERYNPMLKDLSEIPEVGRIIDSKYPGLSQFDRNVLIAACVYSLYCPASLIASRCQNAPANMRDTLATYLGYSNPTNINYWQDIARAHIKGERYIAKVADITSHFRSRSVNPAHWELGV